MKKIFNVLSMVLFAGMLYSCGIIGSPNNEENAANKVDSYTIEQSAYDLEVQNFAKAVNELVNSNRSFRDIIHKEALRQRDGDYDVLISDVADLKLSDESSAIGTKGSVSGMSVKDALEKALLKVSTNTNSCVAGPDSKSSTDDSQDLIGDLMAKYPNLQVSVPIHVEDLNDPDYVPPVTFVTAEAYENKADHLVAYKGNEEIALDAKKSLDSAVIVVGLNERMPSGPEYVASPSAPTLNAIITESGIRLTWTMSSNEDVMGYNIYREESSETTNPEKIAIVSASSAKIYDDNDVEPLKTYTYYVSAYNSGGESASNKETLTAPSLPNPVLSFDAILQSGNEVELRWDNDNSQYVASTKIYKKVQNADDGYNLFGQYYDNKSYAFDSPVSSGSKITYRIVHVNDIGESDFKYDIVYVPYRDITQESPIVLDSISYSWHDPSSGKAIEGWFQGMPEFEIKILGVDFEGKTYEAGSTVIRATATGRFRCHTVLYSWLPSNNKWFDVLSFQVVENDPQIDLTLDISAEFLNKTEDKTSLKPSLAVPTPIKFRNGGNQIGKAYYTYYDPVKYVLSFPNYNFKMYFE
ncbi:MAG: fibronectin type III domain-containing protein [Bacteroidales bacterium]|jgi:hypothetical protein|nr:fibronectin type III domain-containing protein [Bacteroidales bacterium]MCI2122311.1 fibronectin type III domain-containing protein [Bacteroidales bacterium]